MRIFRWECSDALYGFCVNGRIAFIRWHVLHYDTPLPSSSLFITITNMVSPFSHCSLSLCSSISKTPYSLSTSLLLLFPISLDTSYHVSSLSPTIFNTASLQYLLQYLFLPISYPFYTSYHFIILLFPFVLLSPGSLFHYGYPCQSLYFPFPLATSYQSCFFILHNNLQHRLL